MSASVFIGVFFITVQAEDNSRPVMQIALGANRASYAVYVENGSTLPYDVEIHSEIPAANPKFLFSMRAGLQSIWTATFPKLAGIAKSIESCAIATLSRGPDRIQCSEVRYRLNAQFGWTKDRQNLPLSEQIIVT